MVFSGIWGFPANYLTLAPLSSAELLQRIQEKQIHSKQYVCKSQDIVARKFWNISKILRLLGGLGAL